MARAQARHVVGYGLSDALPGIFPAPVMSSRAPLVTDRGYQIGQVWLDKVALAAYILVSVANNTATWNLMAAPAGAGAFTTLTSTGATTLDTTTAANNTFGNVVGTTSVQILVGTGGFDITGVTNSPITIGTNVTTGNIALGDAQTSGTLTIGSTVAGTGDILIGDGIGNQTISIGAGGTGVKALSLGASGSVNVVSIGSITGASSLTLLTGTGNLLIDGAAASAASIMPSSTTGNIDLGIGLTTGTLTLGGTGLQTGTIDIAPGTDAQSILIGATGATGVKTITLGGVAANVIEIGNSQLAGTIDIGTAMTSSVLTMGSVAGTSQTVVQSGTGGIYLRAAGNTTVEPGTVSAAAYAATLNAKVGVATLTGQVLASAAVQVLTITNNLSTVGVPILVTVSNGGANDAKLTMTRVESKLGSFEVTVQNNGAAALNGDITVCWWFLV